ncbi:MAG: hypothetical protein WCC06_12625 [Candidatus Aminicenantales bacterium]
MKLLSRNQLENLTRFKGEDFLTTSFFLDTDKSRLSKKEIFLSLKNILHISRNRLERMEISKEKKESLRQDLEKINAYCSQNLTSSRSSGVAVFSCHGKKFWQVFSLPQPPRNRILFDHNPYIRPLSAILDEYHHILSFLIDRREARWYEIYMGEISPLGSLSSDVPSKVREGGFEGYESKRIERHVEAHLHDHFKKAAQRAFDLFKNNQFHWLFLGCHEKYYSDFEPLLHTYLKSRLKGRLKAKPGDPEDKILKECMELERQLKKEGEEDVVQRLVSELERGGLACSGIKDCLRSLNRAEVQTLVVTLNFSSPGQICPHCRLLYLNDLRCLSCQRKTEPVLDVIDEAIELAMNKNCEVKHISPPSRLNRYGKIGALLRYKT